MKFGIVGLVLLIAAYVGSTVMYGNVGPHNVIDGQPTPDGTTITITLDDVQSVNTVLVGNVVVTPGPALVDSQTLGLKEDLGVRVTSAVSPTKRTWSKGMVPGTFPVPLTLIGNVNDWPFDQYHSGPVTVELFHGDQQIPERATVTFVDHLPGWNIDIPVANKGGALATYRLKLQRSATAAAFALIIIAVLVALAGIGAFVAIQTARDRRPFQPPMTTWYAAMLFAVIPLRNALPNAPPFGARIDVQVVLWVVVVLVLSMMLYISCWWRHLRPSVETTNPASTNPAEPPSSS
ncbi:hypothetical protein MSIMFB_02772 [Mycobacterium simulans]|uniref:DUF4436 domain-containing protein n=1 Tax=Mycobacterium simulans TaxID=627089 RepID=A0A7Z7NAW7_9MYCO|nr:DUF4436 domain-containing protein [Mycobacterium simulans]SOJ55283.1 hypothetical protein MSIMFB_02772 [Mycobacterium simulans]